MRASWIALVLMTSCVGPPSSDEPPAEADRLVFKMTTKEQTLDGCIAGAEGCAYVRLDYPVLVDAPEGYAVTEVTSLIIDSLTAQVMVEGSFPKMEDLMGDFLAGYEEHKARAPADHQPFYLERKVFVLHNTPELLSLSFSERHFTGGAHGLAALGFKNVDPRTGELITLSHVLVDGYEEKLLPLAEARFRKVREIEEGVSLEEAGFTLFENGAFALTDNVSIGETGLTFYYNVYEVAPYALGTTEIFLSYEELGSLLKE